jgi:hypothetical protein
MMFTSQKPKNIGRLAADTASTYVSMAVRLAESLARAGKTLRVFTNDPDRLLMLAGAKSDLLEPSLLEIDPVFPLHLRFYAAHHKLHVFERFRTETWPNCFLDVDIVLSKDSAKVQEMLEQPRAMEAWVYEISAQVFPAYSRAVVQRDLVRLGAPNAFPLWYGGEFILGVPSFFARLSSECNRLLPTYLSLCDSLHHVSDEPVLSAALNTMAHEFAVGDAGDAELIVRYWSGPTLHAQPHAAILRRSAFWHLPDMKWALSREALSRTRQRLIWAIKARQVLMAMRRARG